MTGRTTGDKTTRKIPIMEWALGAGKMGSAVTANI